MPAGPQLLSGVEGAWPLSLLCLERKGGKDRGEGQWGLACLPDPDLPSSVQHTLQVVPCAGGLPSVLLCPWGTSWLCLLQAAVAPSGGQDPRNSPIPEITAPSSSLWPRPGHSLVLLHWDKTYRGREVLRRMHPCTQVSWLRGVSEAPYSSMLPECREGHTGETALDTQSLRPPTHFLGSLFTGVGSVGSGFPLLPLPASFWHFCL